MKRYSAAKLRAMGYVPDGMLGRSTYRRAGFSCRRGCVSCGTNESSYDTGWARDIVVDFNHRGVNGVIKALRRAKRSVAERKALLVEIALRGAVMRPGRYEVKVNDVVVDAVGLRIKLGTPRRLGA